MLMRRSPSFRWPQARRPFKSELGGQSAAAEDSRDAPRRAEDLCRKKEDLEQNTADLPVVMQRQVLVIQKAQRTVDVPLLRYIDTTVDVPVAKQHEDCLTKHNEIEISAQFRTESMKQIVFDSEGPSDLRFAIRCKQRSRVVRCVTLTTQQGGCSQMKLAFVSWRSLRAIPQERVEQRTAERNIDVSVPGACPRVNRRTDRRCACAAVGPARDRRGSDVGPTGARSAAPPWSRLSTSKPQVVEETVEVVQTIPRSASRSVSLTESSMCQVVKQHQVMAFQTVPRTVEIPQVQFLH